MNDEPGNNQERLAANIAYVRSNIAEAAQRSGRSPGEITLVAVSKTVPVELVKIAYNLGVTDFGENRVQEALPKIAEFHPQGRSEERRVGKECICGWGAEGGGEEWMV